MKRRFQRPDARRIPLFGIGFLGSLLLAATAAQGVEGQRVFPVGSLEVGFCEGAVPGGFVPSNGDFLSWDAPAQVTPGQTFPFQLLDAETGAFGIGRSYTFDATNAQPGVFQFFEAAPNPQFPQGLPLFPSHVDLTVTGAAGGSVVIRYRGSSLDPGQVPGSISCLAVGDTTVVEIPIVSPPTPIPTVMPTATPTTPPTKKKAKKVKKTKVKAKKKKKLKKLKKS